LLLHEKLNQNKHVESVWFPCADVGSIPTSSTEVRNWHKRAQQRARLQKKRRQNTCLLFFFFIPIL